MKVASTILNENDYMDLSLKQNFINKIKKWLEISLKNNVHIVVFPALLGCIYPNNNKYLDLILKLSLEYKDLIICPGSCFEVDNRSTFHTSYLLNNGQILIKQRQIYLAKWEKRLGLSRGKEVNFSNIKGLKVGILLSTDVFYPQVSRYMSLSDVDVVLAPTAIKGIENIRFQISGLWQNVQQNLFLQLKVVLKE